MIPRQDCSDLPIDSNGMVPTLNAMGHMAAQVDEFAQDFITYSIAYCHNVADIGPAFGITSLPIINAGIKTTVVDLEKRHIDYIKSHAEPSTLVNINAHVGNFPQTVKLTPNTYGAILVSRVLNFLNVDTLIHALTHLYDALIPGGRLYFISTTPFIKMFEDFIPVYLARRSNHIKWPGVIKNVSEYAAHRAHQYPSYIHLMDLPEIKATLERLDFKIVRAGYIPSPPGQFDMFLDGREHVGVVAEKPKL